MHERELDEEETKYADVRETVRQKERRTEHPCEFEDSDEEGSGALPNARKNRRLLEREVNTEKHGTEGDAKQSCLKMETEHVAE